MLKLDKIQTLEGHTVHGDDTSDHTYYVLPDRPTFSRMPDGGLALRFVEYGQLREDGGQKFGGFVAFDAELAVEEDVLTKIAAKLQEQVAALPQYQGREAPKVQLSTINWLDGAVKLLLKQGGNLVETIEGAAEPSLVGRNIACFSMELTELGTAVFKETLSTGAASGIQLVYDVSFYGRLPEMHAWGTWHASEFYRFVQEIDTEERFWSEDSYTELVSSERYKNDVRQTKIDYVATPGWSEEDQIKYEQQITTMINTQLDEAVKRNLLQAIADVDPSVKDLHEGRDIEDIKRQISKTQIANVRVGWDLAKAIVTDKHPQGMLPTVTSLQDAQGKPLKWEDYYSKINVDEFLKTVQVTIQVSAAFEDLPIHSVEVLMRYPHGPNAKSQEFVFTRADQVERFRTFVHQGIRKVLYSYRVNYENSTFFYQSPEVEMEGTSLVVPVDDLGILSMNVSDGDINFDQVARAAITLKYNGEVDVEQRFNMTRDEHEFTLREIIREAREKPVSYQVNYETADGRQIKGPEKFTDAKVLFIDDPFAAQRTITVRAVGDLGNDIDSIAVDLLFEDNSQGFPYTQRKSVNLSKDLAEDDWTFPALDDRTGKVSYSGVIRRKDTTSTDIPLTEAQGSIVLVGDVVADFLEITVEPILIDWNKVKLVHVALRYSDAPNKVDERMEFTLRPTDGSKVWKLPIKDKAVTGYTSTITYFLKDAANTRRVVGPTPESGLTVFPELV
jgi:hypothetical protein